MNRKLATRLIIAGALLALTFALYYLTQPSPPAPDPTPVPGAAAPAGTDGSSAPAAGKRPASAADSIEGLLARLQSGEVGDAELNALRERLLALPPEQAIAEIRGFLASGKDTALRREFSIGENGELAGAPTLRVWLLDLLGQIARSSGSNAAAVVSREVLQQKSSPDEWAVSLRNVAWYEPTAKPFLAAKMREMLAHEPWMRNPSDGMLEAFDVIVFTQDPTFIPQLASLRGEGPPDLRRAAVVAMDRLSEKAPLEVMNYLNAHPGEFADRPLVRADFYAKADLTAPAHRAAVETYLARQDVSLEEKTKLLGGLATPGSFMSENLVTTNPEPGDDLARLRNYVTVLRQWRAQQRFPGLQNEIARLENRLREAARPE